MAQQENLAEQSLIKLGKTKLNLKTQNLENISFSVSND